MVDSLNEDKVKRIVWTFGRFQPPTVGHQVLIDKVISVAKKHNAEHRIFPSVSNDPKKNPLKHSDKVKWMKKMFRGANIIEDRTLIDPFKVAKSLSDEGYTEVILVVGGDRVDNLRKALGNYVNHKDPNKSFNFTKFEVVSAGNRDPDATDVTGMSASKMRKAVVDGNKKAFSAGVPKSMSKSDKDKLFKAIKKGMGLKENHRIFDFFDYEEFEQFQEQVKTIREPEIKEDTLTFNEWCNLDEISREARRNMSRAAKRTAKKRAKTRKRKAKIKKSGAKLKVSAQKAARNVFKQKFLRGRKWSELGTTERAAIEKRLKKISPAKIQKIAKKLLPGLKKSERERIASMKDLGNKPADVDEAKKRDYKKEYENYHSRPEQRANRSKRTLARRQMEKEGKCSKGDGMDVDHKDGNPQNNNRSNLRVMTANKNRGRDNNKWRK